MRVTLGSFERQTLTEFNKTLTSVRRTAQIPQYVLGGGVLVIGGALGFAAYTAYKYLNLPEFLENPLRNTAGVLLDLTKYGIFGENVNNPLNPQRDRDVVKAATGRFDSYDEIDASYDARIENLEKALAYMRKTNAVAGLNIYPQQVLNKAEKEIQEEKTRKKFAIQAYTNYLIEEGRYDEVRRQTNPSMSSIRDAENAMGG